MIVLRAQLPEQYQQLPPEVLFDGVLEQLINQEILAQQDEAVARAIELRLDNERRALQANEVITDFAATAVTEEAIQAAYDEAVAGAEAEQEFNAAHILVETEDEALALIEELNGGADFAALAQEHSTGPSGPNGGSLGWFGLGMMVPPFEAAVLRTGTRRRFGPGRDPVRLARRQAERDPRQTRTDAGADARRAGARHRDGRHRGRDRAALGGRRHRTGGP
jgi:parvulin-like peptidyl-prolyl isomerase